ncbi:MAG: hypothetical protein ACRELY_20105, partial [Polyangiaceae bacterium]
MRRSSLVSLGCLAPLALLLNCVGDEPAQQDAGADGSIADGNTADGTPSDGSPSDGSVVPLTGAFSSALILPDPTLTFGGLAPVTAAGDVAFGGVLSNVDGTIGINGDPYTSNGGNDMLVLRIAENNGYKWVKSFGGTGADRVNGVVVGGSDDVYVAGTLACATAATTIAIGSVTFTCSHMGTSGVIIKLDGGTGDPQWVQ